MSRLDRGATRLGFADIVTAAILLAILLFAAWDQFPSYDHPTAPTAAASSAAH